MQSPEAAKMPAQSNVCMSLADHDGMAKPLHIQEIEKAMALNPLLGYIEDMLSTNYQESDLETSTDCDTDLELDLAAKPVNHLDGSKVCNGIVTTKAERRADKTRLYNFSKVKKGRKWLKNVLLSDSSSDEEEEPPETRIKYLLKMHKMQKKCQNEFYNDPELQQYQYYGVGLLSNHDRFYEHQKVVVGPKKKNLKEQRKLEKKRLKKMKKGNGVIPGFSFGIPQDYEGGAMPKLPKGKAYTPEQQAMRRKRVWMGIMKKDITKAQKQKNNNRKEMLSTLKKLATQSMKECKRAAIQSQKIMKETPMRARRLCKEMQVYWKRFEKVEKEHRKRAEKEALEQRKMDHEMQEMKRQQRKLNFLITQTELYAHFMARKITGETDADRDQILNRLSEESPQKQRQIKGGLVTDIAGENYNPEVMKKVALKNAKDAFSVHQAKKEEFDHTREKSVFANPDMSIDHELPQPTLFNGVLKAYQLKGMTWLANLYNQGINGILADEMGLGKTVQSIAFLAHLAEEQKIWGPFLVVAPASTLHNWQQEVSRFLPAFKVVPYWGNTQDRKVLRKFWNQEHLHTRNAHFHIVITSYQLVIQDVKYFQRIKWHYMILDEAQALKSSVSVRWKTLLGFNCRNRLLLTGTPIQNSMAELWALLHYIMPTLFDSHEEFNEWFSRDIESHAERQSGIDENQLSRLHMILKPFMLRRVKKDVENELSDKIEILVYCPLTTRQRLLYQAVKNKISIEDLLQSASSNTSQSQSSTSSLMNLVMQFRKVCNHPELFERRETRGPFTMRLDDYNLPKLVYREGMLSSNLPSKDHILYNMLYIHNAEYIQKSLKPSQDGNVVTSEFSFLRFINISPAEINSIMLRGLFVRWLAILLWLEEAERLWHRAEWDWRSPPAEDHLDHRGLLLQPLRTTYFPNVRSSHVLTALIFTSYKSAMYGHCTHVRHCMPETIAHRKIRYRRHSGRSGPAPGQSAQRSPTKLSPVLSPTKKNAPLDFALMAPHPHIAREPIETPLQPTEFPAYLYYAVPRALANFQQLHIVDRSAQWDKMATAICGSVQAHTSMLYGTEQIAYYTQNSRHFFRHCEPGGLLGIPAKHGYSGVYVPDKETMITDAGKLYVLDTLLVRLKREGHRVLIYSQMTRMIDILEEYMWHRKHTYMRLDGSSKISDRRDMVADFQTRSDIFVFLLSTRAGGLGINLTAADTVIFYDSDWNPTVDQQAMDRAHRLGQTKQVTVYRLICDGTIEKRILQRAKEKSEIQRMVISGGNLKPDTLKPKEVVSLLLDDDEMERKLLSKQADKGWVKDGQGQKRKREPKEGKKGGRGPGRPRKVKVEENNVTIAAGSTPPTSGAPSLAGGEDSMMSIDSACPSPLSAVSVGSDAVLTAGLDNDSSNDGLVIVDEPTPAATPSSVTERPTVGTLPVKKTRGRPRGRPPGSGVLRHSGRGLGPMRGVTRKRGRGSVQKAMAAAELAAAQAGKSAGYAAYGYSYHGEKGQSINKPGGD